MNSNGRAFVSMVYVTAFPCVVVLFYEILSVVIVEIKPRNNGYKMKCENMTSNFIQCFF